MTESRIMVEYRQFMLAPFGAAFEFDPSWNVDRVVHQTTGDRGLTISTGIVSGIVMLRIGSYAADKTVRPGWSGPAECEIFIDEPLYVSSPTIADPGIHDPIFEPKRPGKHLVSVVYRNRKSEPDMYGFDSPDDADLEHYWVAITPS